jgi:O-antigen/teichoic acid export membrane protein
MSRPGIVTFNALINLFFGCVFTFINLVVITGSNPHAGGSAWHFWEYDPDVVIPIGLLTILSICNIFVFFGLWRLRSWGRTLFNILNVFLALCAAVLALNLLPEDFKLESGVARIVFSVLALVFLTAPLGMAKPEIKELFKD